MKKNRKRLTRECERRWSNGRVRAQGEKKHEGVEEKNEGVEKINERRKR